jgi:hypothetical protein
MSSTKAPTDTAQPGAAVNAAQARGLGARSRLAAAAIRRFAVAARPFAVRRGGGQLAAVTARLPRAWQRAAVAIAAALSAACVSVPAAQALSLNTEIAIQANTGNLWTWTATGGAHDTGLGMMQETSPSVAPLSGFGSNHEIAFQANTGDLWTTGAFGQGDMHLGMEAGTSPSLGAVNRVAFVANTGDPNTPGDLWITGQGDTGISTAYPDAWDASSPSAAGTVTAVAGPNGELWARFGDWGYPPVSWPILVNFHTSPSINANTDVAFQGANGDLYTARLNAIICDDTGGRCPTSSGIRDTGLGMKLRTSPSINDSGLVAFQANTGHLWVGGRDTFVQMMPGTSPSIDDHGDVAFQGFDGNLGLLVAGASRALNLGLGMKAGTSPSIGLDPGN